jgi:hypothetical protein
VSKAANAHVAGFVKLLGHRIVDLGGIIIMTTGY